MVLVEMDACFEIHKMTASGIIFPEKIEVDENMLFKRSKTQLNVGFAHIRFLTTQEEMDSKPYGEITNYQKAQERILNFASFFALHFGWAILVRACRINYISNERKFGSVEGLKIKFGEVQVKIPPEKIEERNIAHHEILNNLSRYFRRKEEEVNKVNNFYVKNSLNYFYYGSQNVRLEERIINYFVSVESLVGEKNNTTKKIASRTAFLLNGKIDGKNFLDVYKDMKKLYNLRCCIVHGRKYEVSRLETKMLREYTKKLVTIFLKIFKKKSRKNILDLVDEQWNKLKSH